MGRIILLLFAATLAVFGLSLLLTGANGLKREYEARSWPKVAGVITEAAIVASEGSKHKKNWCPTWTYRYSLSSAKIYLSKRTAFGSSSCERSLKSAEQKLMNRPIGSNVEVIYDPKEPAFSALIVSEDRGFFWWFLLFAGCGFSWMSIIAVDDSRTRPTVDGEKNAKH